jgi:type II secretory pathway pseudopilin PulG
MRYIISIFQQQKGLGLVETLVAVAILGTAVVAFIAALSAGTLAVGAQDEEAVIQRLARSQLEYTKSYTYIPGAKSYPTIAVPENYALAVAVSAVPGTDANIQKITVTVSRDSQILLTVSDYKVNRYGHQLQEQPGAIERL